MKCPKRAERQNVVNIAIKMKTKFQIPLMIKIKDFKRIVRFFPVFLKYTSHSPEKAKSWFKYYCKYYVKPGFEPRSSHTKDTKMLPDTSLLNTQHYKVLIKGKVKQFRERSSTHSYTSV